MSKNIILCFDGTSNESQDAHQDITWFGPEDDSVTNVFKLHLFFGGDLRQESVIDGQISLYYPGIGTYGRTLKRIWNKLFAPENKDVGDIIRAAGADLQARYEAGDQIFLFGFSRGAAIARRFAAVLHTFIPLLPHLQAIRFAGLFDTVASIGAPNLNSREKPLSDVVFENGSISLNIKEALHLLALDEKRKAFEPTLMNRDERVTEVWFAGAHSDVGGGYRYDGLSDVALQFMLEEISRRNLGLKLLAPNAIDYNAIDQDNPDIGLDYDDVIIQPNPYGMSHQQKRPPISTTMTLGDRLLRVNQDDEPSDAVLPFVHRSVVDRLLNDADYRPEPLRRRRHRVWYSHSHTPEAEGLRDHLLNGRPALKELEPEEEVVVVVHANLKRNKTGIRVAKGATYRFTVFPDDVWYDAGIDCGAAGWDRQTEELGLREIFIRLKEDDRRYPEAK